MGHPARVRILALLRDGALYVCQVRSVLGLAASTVSAHLAILRRAGLITEEKQGRWVRYRLTTDEPLGSLTRETLYLVRTDEQVASDAALMAAVRRTSVESLCRSGLRVTAPGVGQFACRRIEGSQHRVDR